MRWRQNKTCKVLCVLVLLCLKFEDAKPSFPSLQTGTYIWFCFFFFSVGKIQDVRAKETFGNYAARRKVLCGPISKMNAKSVHQLPMHLHCVMLCRSVVPRLLVAHITAYSRCRLSTMRRRCFECASCSRTEGH